MGRASQPVAVALVLLGAAACAGSAAPNGPGQLFRDAPAPVALAYSVFDPVAGVTDAYAIDPTGHVQASRRAAAAAASTRSYALSVDAQAALQEAIDGVDFGALDATYGQVDATCDAVTTVSFIAASSRTDIVVGCGATLPDALSAALAAIRAAIAAG